MFNAKYEKIKKLLKKSKCIHDWVKQGEDKYETVTPYANHPNARKKYQYVLVLSCKKCGLLDKTIEKI